MQDRPTAAELLDALRGFLEHDIAPAVGGRVGFHTRVAVNVVRILERELALGPDALRAERERLSVLLGGDVPDVAGANADLARRIRAGALDDRWEDTLELVRETVVDKLRIANPAWLQDRDREG